MNGGGGVSDRVDSDRGGAGDRDSVLQYHMSMFLLMKQKWEYLKELSLE